MFFLFNLQTLGVVWGVEVVSKNTLQTPLATVGTKEWVRQKTLARARQISPTRNWENLHDCVICQVFQTQENIYLIILVMETGVWVSALWPLFSANEILLTSLNLKDRHTCKLQTSSHLCLRAYRTCLSKNAWARFLKLTLIELAAAYLLTTSTTSGFRTFSWFDSSQI